MMKPKLCPCGGTYKKTVAYDQVRTGSRYFQCDRCKARLEQTADGYELKDAAPPAPPRPAGS